MKADSLRTRMCRLSIVCLSLALVAAGYCVAAEIPAPSGTLMLFPVANKAGDAGARCAEDMFLLVKEQLTSLGTVRVIAYNPKNVSVERMIREQRLDEKAAADIFDTDAAGQTKALKIGYETGVQLVVLASLDKYQYDADAQKLEMTATLQLLDVAAQTPTRKVTHSATAQGGTGALAKTEEALCVQALAEVVDQFFARDKGVRASDVAVAAAEDSVQVERPTPKKKGLLPAMLVAVLLGLLLGGGG